MCEVLAQRYKDECLIQHLLKGNKKTETEIAMAMHFMNEHPRIFSED